jgi:hypothetical protein
MVYLDNYDEDEDGDNDENNDNDDEREAAREPQLSAERVEDSSDSATSRLRVISVACYR